MAMKQKKIFNYIINHDKGQSITEFFEWISYYFESNQYR